MPRAGSSPIFEVPHDVYYIILTSVNILPPPCIPPRWSSCVSRATGLDPSATWFPSIPLHANALASHSAPDLCIFIDISYPSVHFSEFPGGFHPPRELLVYAATDGRISVSRSQLCYPFPLLFAVPVLAVLGPNQNLRSL